MIKRDTLQLGSRKPVKSFVAREGRMTHSQKLILEEMWSTVGLALQDTNLDLVQVFKRQAPVNLEIGFGDGRSLLASAIENPLQDFIGIEVYKTGIAKLCHGIKARKLTNVRIFCADALEVLQYCIPDACLQQVQLLFPDPWPKLRHHKRRIVQPAFVTLVQKKLIEGGLFHMATDWEQYANHMLATMEQLPDWHNTAGQHNFAIRPSTRPLTKFETRGHRLGYGTWDLIFRKCHNI